MKPFGALYLARKWEYCCIVCGRKIESFYSFSVEHMIPRCKIDFIRNDREAMNENIAPSHYNCNQFRKTMSLIEASIKINEHLKKLGNKAIKWLNKPNRGRFWLNNLHTSEVMSVWGN